MDYVNVYIHKTSRLSLFGASSLSSFENKMWDSAISERANEKLAPGAIKGGINKIDPAWGVPKLHKAILEVLI